MQVSSLDEFALIARLTRSFSSHPDVLLGVGDDCAVLDLSSSTALLATCDSQVEGIHFTLYTSTPEQIGRKALAVNISDIAAMGGIPRFALISLILPPHFPLASLEGIYSGLQQEAESFSLSLVGGNIASSGPSSQLIIDITLLGSADRTRILTRSGAQVGDILCVTGHPGDSAAGLYTLLHPDIPYSPSALKFVQTAHLTPQPRVREGQLLAQFGPQVITSLLDISDGLSGDLSHICERSQVGALLNVPTLPFSPSILTIASESGQNPLLWTLHGGEDYELLFTVSPTHLPHVQETFQRETDIPITPIGTILPPESGLQLLLPDGRTEPLSIKSWNHLT